MGVLLALVTTRHRWVPGVNTRKSASTKDTVEMTVVVACAGVVGLALLVYLFFILLRGDRG